MELQRCLPFGEQSSPRRRGLPLMLEMRGSDSAEPAPDYFEKESALVAVGSPPALSSVWSSTFDIWRVVSGSLHHTVHQRR
jgi:hypothetical protein